MTKAQTLRGSAGTMFKPGTTPGSGGGSGNIGRMALPATTPGSVVRGANTGDIGAAAGTPVPPMGQGTKGFNPD